MESNNLPPKIINNNSDTEGWEEVGGFGKSGRIFAKGDLRKKVEEGYETIYYSAEENRKRLKLKNENLIVPKGDIKLDA